MILRQGRFTATITRYQVFSEQPSYFAFHYSVRSESSPEHVLAEGTRTNLSEVIGLIHSFIGSTSQVNSPAA